MTGHDPRNHVGAQVRSEAVRRYGSLVAAALLCGHWGLKHGKPSLRRELCSEPSRASRVAILNLMAAANRRNAEARHRFETNMALAALPMFHVEQPPDPPRAA